MFLIGNKYSNWEIIGEAQKKNKKTVYPCSCKCGNKTLVRSEVLKKSDSEFCTKCRHKDKELVVGETYGKWTVIQEIKTEEKRKHYIVKCECGAVKIQKGIRLRFGDSKACRTCGSTKHKLSYSATYRTWESMIQRCTNSKNTNYKHYGARGIKVCESWLCFEGFIEDMGERPQGKELDRINNDGNYDKNNCRWVTHQENLNNRTRLGQRS
jgi:hypothetical protein